MDLQFVLVLILVYPAQRYLVTRHTKLLGCLRFLGFESLVSRVYGICMRSFKAC